MEFSVEGSIVGTRIGGPNEWCMRIDGRRQAMMWGNPTRMLEISTTTRCGLPRQELPMSTDAITPLRQRMIEDMNARKLGAHSQRSHVSSCNRFATFLKRSPDTATPDDVRRFQLHWAETGMSICNRNRIMTEVKFLFRSRCGAWILLQRSITFVSRRRSRR
jgi:hypothetical protein